MTTATLREHSSCRACRYSCDTLGVACSHQPTMTTATLRGVACSLANSLSAAAWVPYVGAQTLLNGTGQDEHRSRELAVAIGSWCNKPR